MVRVGIRSQTSNRWCQASATMSRSPSSTTPVGRCIPFAGPPPPAAGPSGMRIRLSQNHISRFRHRRTGLRIRSPGGFRCRPPPADHRPARPTRRVPTTRSVGAGGSSSPLGAGAPTTQRGTHPDGTAPNNGRAVAVPRAGRCSGDDGDTACQPIRARRGRRRSSAAPS